VAWITCRGEIVPLHLSGVEVEEGISRIGVNVVMGWEG